MMASEALKLRYCERPMTTIDMSSKAQIMSMRAEPRVDKCEPTLGINAQDARWGMEQ
jgi:hypothetical protein